MQALSTKILIAGINLPLLYIQNSLMSVHERQTLERGPLIAKGHNKYRHRLFCHKLDHFLLS